MRKWARVLASSNHPWLHWARAIQAITQTGMHYTENPFDMERYQQLQAIATKMLAAHSNASVTQVQGLFDQQAGATTPKVDVRGVVFRENAILLVRERQDSGRWTLPGGWADVNEPPSAAVVREVREESGYETRAVKLLAVYDRDLHGHPPHPFHIYKLFFLCELIGGSPLISIETDGAEFFTAEAIPEDLSLGRVTDAQLRRLFEHYYNPDLPTDFDYQSG